MFSNNQKISLRQTFRLFTFDFLGISTLIIPSYLAVTGGIYGVISIALGILAGLVYLSYLKGVLNRMQTDLLTYMEEESWIRGFWKRLIFFYLAFSCIITAVDASVVFTCLMKESLIREESYLLILALVLFVSAYAVSGGIESRARIYELTFWFILIPLVAMLAFSLKGIRMEYLFVPRTFDVSQIVQGGYLVFITWETLFFVLLFPAYVSKEQTISKLTNAVRRAFLLAAVLLLVLYVILLLTFGEHALAHMKFPAVTLMSTVQIAGGFVKRLDALMMGIWFFTLFALISLNLHYGAQFLQRGLGIHNRKLSLGGIAVCVFLLAVVAGYRDGVRKLIEEYYAWIGMPLYILLPGIIALRKRKNKGVM